ALERTEVEGVRELTRAEVNQLPGPVLLEFGASWGGNCQAICPRLAALLSRFPHVRPIKIEDGKGKPLGGSFRVKLWPTLVFLKDGKVLKQVARPTDAEMREGLETLGSARSGEAGA